MNRVEPAVAGDRFPRWLSEALLLQRNEWLTGGWMTEEMWLASQEPRAMLTYLRELGVGRKLGFSLKRKLRLFVVAQCRRLRQDSKMQARCDHLVRLAVRHADGLASRTDLRIARAQTDYELDFSNTGFFQS